ncbi:MAG: DMT family transporter [Cytophagales bacterium]|nr:DMT family transporter [Cytophagales bacterium]
MKPILKAHLAVFGANFIYGLNYSIAKGLMPNHFSPPSIIFIRVLVSGGLFFLLSRFYIGEKIARKDLFRLACCGLFGVAVNQLFFFEGLNLTTQLNASILMTSNPIIVFLLAMLLKIEYPSKLRLTGIMLGAAGAVLLLSYGKRLELGAPNILLGNAFVLLNATSYAVYLLLVKPLMKKYHPLTVISWVFAFGSLFVFPVTASEAWHIQWRILPVSALLSLGFVVIFTTFFAYLLNVVGLKSLRSSTVSFYLYCQPVVAALVNVFAGEELFTWEKGIAFMLICLGVFLVSKPALPKKPRSAQNYS